MSEQPTADGARYIARVESLVGSRDPAAVLAATPDALARALSGVPGADGRRPEAPGGWSLRDVALHLADAELVYAERLRVVLTTVEPVYPPFDQEARLALLRSAGGSLGETLDRFRLLRADSLRLIARLDAAAHALTGTHATRGRETVEQLIRRWAGHDLVHLAQMARIRSAISIVDR